MEVAESVWKERRKYVSARSSLVGCCCYFLARRLTAMLLLIITFSVLVANPRKLLYTVANPTRGLLSREKRTKPEVWQHTLPPTHCSFGEKQNNKNHATHVQALRRSQSASRLYKDIFGSSTINRH